MPHETHIASTKPGKIYPTIASLTIASAAGGTNCLYRNEDPVEPFRDWKTLTQPEGPLSSEETIEKNHATRVNDKGHVSKIY
jgi:hypothetical protein